MSFNQLFVSTLLLKQAGLPPVMFRVPKNNRYMIEQVGHYNPAKFAAYPRISVVRGVWYCSFIGFTSPSMLEKPHVYHSSVHYVLKLRSLYVHHYTIMHVRLRIAVYMA